ncbi:MAG: glycosyltransferase family 2 protein [Chloroflexota bacterium]
MDQKNPHIFIIVLNWNRPDDTIACIDSLQQLHYQHVQIVVADNGSTDDSVQRIRAYSDQVAIVENEENLGFAGGNNQGIKYALQQGADYIMLLNNDTVVAPDMVDHLLQAFHSDSNLGLVGPSIYYMDQPEDLWFTGMNFPFNIYFIGRHLLVYAKEAEKKIDVGFISGCCMLIKTSVIEKVGMLNEDYFMYYEDLDFCLQVQYGGFTLAYISAAKMWHKVSASSGGKSSPMKQYYQVKSSIFFFRQHVKGIRLVISIALRLGHASITVLRETIAGRVTFETLKKYFRGVSEALLNRPANG